MLQLIVLAITFPLLGWMYHLASRRRRPLPPLPVIEPLTAAQRDDLLTATAQELSWQRLARFPRRIHALRLLHPLLRCADHLPALDFLRNHGRALLMPLMSLREELHHAPRLPGTRSIPRMLVMCQRYLLAGGSVDPEQLLTALAGWQSAGMLTLKERLLVPLCLRLALAEQLDDVLANLHHSLEEARLGRNLARKLIRARRPMELLNARHLTLTSAQTMLTHLADCCETTLLTVLEERMRQDGCTTQRLFEQYTSQQARLSDHLSRILSAFQALEKLDWPSLQEPSDPIHLLLGRDPTGTYPRMDAPSRMLYRRRVDTLARLFSVDEPRLCREILLLCGAADPDGLRDHVGWYLLEDCGMSALRRHLHVRRGFLRLFLRQHAFWLRRIFLSLLALMGSLVFLHSGHPLWALPVFLGVESCLAHTLTDMLFRRLLPPFPLPRMHIDRVTDEMRTLVVIPTVLRDRNQAVPAVRRLLLARKAFPEGAVDCLLLADYDDCLTLTSSEDPAIVMAARMAIDAVDGDGGRMLYMQRRRVWDGDQRAFIGRERQRGALEGLHQLIVHGRCDDTYDEATLPPSALHRRYAYVLTLDANTTPGPDALLPLIGALTHPLNERRHTAEGVRGVSIVRPRLLVDPSTVRSRISLWEGGAGGVVPVDAFTADNADYDGQGLYRPDSLLEATEGWFLPDTLLCHHLLEEHIAGCAQDASAAFYVSQPASMAGWLKRCHRHTRADWQLLPWLMPHVKTPSGVRRTPLSSHDRYMLRQRLRKSLAPVCRLLLLLYAVAARSLPLTLFALLVQEASLHSAGTFLARLTQLPLRSAIRADGVARALWRTFIRRGNRLEQNSAALDSNMLSAWENWCQALAAVLFAVAALLPLPASVTGLMLASAFACFPLVHPWLDAPLHRAVLPTPGIETDLMEIAASTWRFFEENVTDGTRHLPPESLQLKPWRGPSRRTTPAAIGLYLLSCLAMRELGEISTEDMCRRVSLTVSAMEQLPLWHGLPYRRYNTDSLAPCDQSISGADCGLLCACLIALAQGLRSYLPETPDEYAPLALRADAFAGAMELHRLYDPSVQLFLTEIQPDASASSSGHFDLYASEGLLLSFVAVMRREAPPEHLARLNRTLVRAGRDTLLVSWRGAASDYLLAYLLLPVAHGTMMDHTLQAVIRAQRRSGVDGMFGISSSGWWAFDAQLNYQRRDFGLPETALGPCAPHKVIAPYAAALALPFALREAHESLVRLRSRGMLGQAGYFDSIDLDPAHLPEGSAEAVVQIHMAEHQGILLCALCNALTDKVLVRHFSSVPEAAAASILLQEKRLSRLTLPPRCIHPENLAPREPSFHRSAQPMTAPVDAHIIGSPEAMMLMSAQGMGMMLSRGVALTRFTGDPTELEGIQFYLHDGQRSYRLTDPTLSGDTSFSEGRIRFIRTCGQVQTNLTAITDPVQGAFLHRVEAMNLSDRERSVDIASFLAPELREITDFSPQDSLTIETGRPEERVLTLSRRGDPTLTLCHAVSTHEPLLGLAVETDRLTFQGRDHTLRHPACLDAPLRDGLVGAPVTPCVSFRVRLRLAPRGRTAVVFVTRLMRPGEAFSLESLAPRLSDFTNAANLSALLSRTITESLSLSQTRAGMLSRLFGPLMWLGQPHQGAITPLMHHRGFLDMLNIDTHQPMMLMIVHSPGCSSLMRDARDATQWLKLMGQCVSLCVLCEGDQAAGAQTAVREILHGLPAAVLIASELPDGGRETIEAVSRLILYEGAGSITAQVEAMAQRLPAIEPPLPETAAPDLEQETLRHDNGLGGFQSGTDDYVIRLEDGAEPPSPWCFPLTGDGFGTMCTESGLGGTFIGLNWLTFPCKGDDIPLPCECAYLHDESRIFTPTPLSLGQGLNCRVQLSPGVTVWRSLGHGLDMTLTAAVVPDASVGCRTLRLKNLTQREQRFTLTIATRFLMGQDVSDENLTCLTPVEGGVIAASPALEHFGCLALMEGHCESRAVSPLAFHGFCGAPDMSAPSDEAGTLAILSLPMVIPPGGSQAVTWLLGACRQMDELEALIVRLRQSGSSAVYREARQCWSAQLAQLRISTPDDSLDLLFNRILPWQLHTVLPAQRCDFRELLLSSAGLACAGTEYIRVCLLECAQHQYTEGDVQRRWQSPGTGLRTRCTGDRLLLPLMTCWYIQRTGDTGILQEQLPWLLGEPIPQTEERLWHTPPATNETDTLYTHCLRALTSIPMGSNGLPLANTGRHGESVLLGMIYACTLRHFARHAPDGERSEMEDVRLRMEEAIQRVGWDGSWYRRGFLEDGTPLGSASSPECRIDVLTQCWAVLTYGVTERTLQATEEALRQLYDPRRRLLKAFTPAFDGKLDAGDVQAHPPGIDENGAHSTQAACWMLLALFELGQAERAWELLHALNPIHRSDDPARYRLEPYALSGFVYTHPQQLGRGGQRWHAGSAAWLHAIVLEKLLGFEKRGDQVRLRPMVPPDWDGFTLTLQWGASTWRFHASVHEPLLTLDGVGVSAGWITLKDDGRIHEVRAPLRRG